MLILKNMLHDCVCLISQRCTLNIEIFTPFSPIHLWFHFLPELFYDVNNWRVDSSRKKEERKSDILNKQCAHKIFLS